MGVNQSERTNNFISRLIPESRPVRYGIVLGLSSAALAGCGGKARLGNEQRTPAGQEASQPAPQQTLPKPNEVAAAPQPQQEQTPENIDYSSPTNVAMAFVEAAVEADGETFCQLSWDSGCDPGVVSGHGKRPSYLIPTGVQSSAEKGLGVAEVDLITKDRGLWCVQLNNNKGRWLVDFYSTAPPGAQCNQ
ncbi:MAG TPA: hypothetical protein VLE51_00825 [Candidatus Saccharimonadales bacterium]|nr:hypothetical protein [Candidatus Saccharimonadales bacterium]